LILNLLRQRIDKKDTIYIHVVYIYVCCSICAIYQTLRLAQLEVNMKNLTSFDSSLILSGFS